VCFGLSGLVLGSLGGWSEKGREIGIVASRGEIVVGIEVGRMRRNDNNSLSTSLR